MYYNITHYLVKCFVNYSVFLRLDTPRANARCNIWGQQLKEFDYWLMFADFENYPCFQQHLFDDRPGNSGEGPRKEGNFGSIIA